MKLFLAIFLLIALISGCESNGSPQRFGDYPKPKSSASKLLRSRANLNSYLDSVEFMFSEWNRGYIDHDTELLLDLFSRRAHYIGEEMSIYELREQLDWFFDDYPNYNQDYTLDGIQFPNEYTDITRAYAIVQNEDPDQEDPYSEYVCLMFKTVGGDMQIVGETTDVSDAEFYYDKEGRTSLPLGKSTYQLDMSYVEEDSTGTQYLEPSSTRFEFTNNGGSIDTRVFIYYESDDEEFEIKTKETYFIDDDLIVELSDYYFGDWDNDLNSNDYMDVTFRVLNDKIVMVDADDPEWVGFHFWKQ